MQWYKGSDYQEKLNNLIDQMLSTNETTIFFVEEKYIVDYERLILEKSKFKAYNHIQVISLEKYCYQVLKEQYFFRYQPIDSIELYCLIKEALTTIKLTVFTNIQTDSAFIKQLILALEEIDLYQLKKENILDYMPEFSGVKFNDLLNIYQYVIKNKNKYHLFNSEIYRISQPYFNHNYQYFCDGIESLSFSQLSLLTSLPNCIITKTTYNNHLTSTNSDDLNYVLGFKGHLTKYFLSKKTVSYNEPTNFKFINAKHKKEEIEIIANLIYQQLVQNNLHYSDFIIYVNDNNYLPFIKTIFKDFDLPIKAFNLNDNYQDYPIYQFILLFFKCLMTKEIDSYLGEMLYNNLLEGLFDQEYIDYINHCINNDLTFENIFFTKAKIKLKNKIDAFQSQKTISSFSTVLYDWLIEPQSKKAFIKFDEAYLSMLNFLENLMKFDNPITLDEYQDLFINYYHDSPKNENKQDRIQILSLNEQTSMVLKPKFIYILGCNENFFPLEIKDNGLILDEDRNSIKQFYPQLKLQSHQIKDYQTIIFKTITQSDNITLSYSNGSYQGQELLPSLMYQHIKDLANQPKMLIKQTLSNQKRYIQDYFFKKNLPIIPEIKTNDTFIKTKNLIDTFIKTKNQPVNLKQDLVKKLYQKNSDLYTSSSQLEAFNSCPYRHYLIYGLSIKPLNNQILNPSDIGIIQHDLLDLLKPLYQSKKAVENTECLKQLLKQYTIKQSSSIIMDLNQLITRVLKQYLNQSPKLIKKIQKDYYSSLIIKQIIADTNTNLLILMYHIKMGKFEVLETEKWAQKTLNHGVILTGKVDRVDIYQDFIKVLDYKSSSKALELPLVIQGFNIQMLLYLEMLSTQLNKKKGAVVYFNLSPRQLKAKNKLSLKTEPFEDFIKQYQMEGYLVKDVNHLVMSGIDQNYAGNKSSIVKMNYVKKNDDYSGNLLEENQLNNLFKQINKVVDQMVEEIFIDGNIAIAPSSHEKSAIKMKVNPCNFCDYKTVCQKDVFYNKERMIIDYKKDDIQKLLKGGEIDETN